MRCSKVINRREYRTVEWEKREKLGEILLAEGVISVDALQKALRRQKESGKKLGEILVEIGAIDEERLNFYLGEQLGIESRHLERFFVPDEMLTLVGTDLITGSSVIPLFARGKTLRLAMVDPLDTSTVEKIEERTGFSVEPSICSQRSLSICIAVNIPDLEPDPDTGVSEEDIRAGRLLRRLLIMMRRENCCELHLEVRGHKTAARMGWGGNLRVLEKSICDLNYQTLMSIRSFLGDDRKHGRSTSEMVCRIGVGSEELSLRMNILETLQGESLAIRLANRIFYVSGLEGTGMTPDQQRQVTGLLDSRKGLVVIAAPKVQGKTVTMYAILKHLSDAGKAAYLLEESPMDRLDFVSQVPIGNAGGEGLEVVLKSVMKHAPDVIGIGECRDATMLKNILSGAANDALVLTTLPVSDFTEAWMTMLSMTGDPEILSRSVAGVISQRLFFGAPPAFQVVELTPAFRAVVANCYDSSTLNFVLSEHRFGTMDEILRAHDRSWNAVPSAASLHLFR